MHSWRYRILHCMIKNLITGATGFIGLHLLKKLKWANVLHHEDIIHGNSYDADRLFFLSTYGNMAHHNNHPMMINANVMNVLSILNGFRGWICYMSSSSVTLQVQTPYSRSKRAAEEILQALPGLKSCIVRPYSVTGVGEQKAHLIPTLIRSCMEGEEMPFDPYPVHDFIDVEDVVDALVEFSEHGHTGIFELGNGIPYTNQAVKELVEEVTSRKANIVSTPRLRPYDSSAWYCKKPSIKGKKSLIQSITEMVDAYEQNR
jgi:nucleoside-diphosphate-sugar epimerase